MPIGLARESLAEARRSVEALRPEPCSRPPRLPEALADGRPAVVGADTASRSRWPPPATSSPLHPEVEVALLRTAQEALANVAKHANATRAGLTLSYMGDVVTLDVRDDGVGLARCPPAKRCAGAASG